MKQRWDLLSFGMDGTDAARLNYSKKSTRDLSFQGPPAAWRRLVDQGVELNLVTDELWTTYVGHKGTLPSDGLRVQATR
ncbi:MAG TPA: hypothetical protein VI756_12790 [Blastocatellia bacterium]